MGSFAFVNDYAEYKLVLIILSCCAFGFYHKTIRSVEGRKWSATILGFIVTVIVMRWHCWYPIVSSIISIIIMLHAPKRSVHIMTTIFFFSYTAIFRYFVPPDSQTPTLHMNFLHMVLTMKIVGASLEIHNAHKKRLKKDDDTTRQDQEEDLNPDFMDLFHYTFSYLGMFLGPYIRIKTYNDFIHLPFHRVVKCLDFFIPRMVIAAICSVSYRLLTECWPTELVRDPAFLETSFAFKMFYGFIHLQRFRFWMISGNIMAQAVSMAAGLGAYPEQCKSTHGHGPTRDHHLLKTITAAEATALKFDFETVNGTTIVPIFTTTWLKEYTQHWNKLPQYWISQNFYFNLFSEIPSRNLAMFLTWMVCAFWHGNESGHFICCGVIAIYAMAEKNYYKMYLLTTGKTSTIFKCIMWVIFMHIYSHAIVVFNILDYDLQYTYDSSIYFVPYISLALFWLLGEPLLKLATKYYKENELKTK